MKKVLVSLLVLALAMSSVFAAVNLSGSFTAGYAFNLDGKFGDKTLIWGDDKARTNTLKFDITASDEDGVWSISSGEGTLLLDGRLNANLSVDVMKLFDADSDLSVSLGLAVNDEQAVLRAYSNQSGKNFDRARTAADGVWASLTVGYTDLVQVQVAGSPATAGLGTNPNTEDADNPTPADGVNTIGDNKGDLAISVKSVPTEGVAVSAGWILNGKNDNGTETDGVLAIGADANVGALADLGFDLGVSAAYKFGFGPKQNVIAATVYGGVDMVDLAVEYAFQANEATHYLYLGADFSVVENMDLGAYFGANNLAKFADEWFVGGNVGYTVKGVTFNCAVEYAAGMGYLDDGELTGFSVVPSVKVAF